MARMIDADALKDRLHEALEFQESVDNYEGAELFEIAKDIADEQPTIDAIPVEWLRRYTAVGVAPTGDRLTEGKERLLVHRILNEWQKEQEAQD